jgi:hypothetical protein
MAINDRKLERIFDWLDGLFKENSTDDMEARRALAKLLRHGPLTLSLRKKLANLIDPNMRDAEIHWLVFKRARRANSVSHWQVAAVVWHRVKAGDRRKAAYQYAVETLGVSFNTAEKAFAHWEKYFHVNAPPELGD